MADQEKLSFAKDIRPMFTDMDVEHMKSAGMDFPTAPTLKNTPTRSTRRSVTGACRRGARANRAGRPRCATASSGGKARASHRSGSHRSIRRDRHLGDDRESNKRCLSHRSCSRRNGHRLFTRRPHVSVAAGFGAVGLSAAVALLGKRDRADQRVPRRSVLDLPNGLWPGHRNDASRRCSGARHRAGHGLGCRVCARRDRVVHRRGRVRGHRRSAQRAAASDRYDRGREPGQRRDLVDSLRDRDRRGRRCIVFVTARDRRAGADHRRIGSHRPGLGGHRHFGLARHQRRERCRRRSRSSFLLSPICRHIMSARRAYWRR